MGRRADPRLCRSLVLPDKVRRAGSGLDVKLDFSSSSVPDYSQDPEKDVIVGSTAFLVDAERNHG